MSGSNNTPTLTSFTSGDLVISISGDGDGSGSYGDNQASPITLDEITTAGTLVGQLVLPQTTTIRNGTTEYAISGEYGSSSEGSLALSADGQSLVIAGYGVTDTTFNSGGATVYGTTALAQSTSVQGGQYTAVARVIADISYNATIDTSTALYNVDNLNNPRSVATVNGTSFYLSGQGKKGDTTQGVQYAQDGASSATIIDDSTDTRTAEIVNGVLYVSRDSTQGTGGTSNIASYGTLPTSATAPVPLAGINGTVTLTAAQENSVNASAVGTTVNLSPENYFFANATTLYVADGGNPKEGGLGDGGLQKWVYNGTTWTLEYTLSAGLNLVADTASAGTTGLIGLTGVVTGNTVELYATNSTLGDLDPTYVYAITDTLASTTGQGESFNELMAAPADSNIRGIAFAPSASTGAPTMVTVSGGTPQPGLTVTSGSTLTVLSGGAIVSGTILSGGTATVSSGGTDTGSTIGQGGTETLLGTASGDQVEGTQIVSNATAVVSNETVYNGGQVDLFMKGAVASAVTVDSGGTIYISGNATASNTVISGGTVVMESAKAVVAGSLVFSGGGVLDLTTVLSAGYGDLAVISGFGSGDVINDTAIGTGATLSTSVVSGNTVATVSSGGVSQAFTFAGSGTTVNLTSNGSGGIEIVTSGGSTGSSGGTTSTVSSGSTQPNLVVSGGETLTVAAGGTIVTATIQSAGTVILSGTDSGSTINAGGNETVLGTATGDQVYGTQLVSAATAVANGETVYNGGTVDLFLKGVTASGLVVQSGGTVNANGNISATNTVMSGGVFDLQSPKATLAGSFTFAGPATLELTDVSSAGYGDLAVISGFVTGDLIDDTVIATGAQLTSAVVSGNTVETISGGGVSQSYIFAGTYGAGYFMLAPDTGTGVEITATGTPCYCRGTLILTETGERTVEELRIGDAVVTQSGAARPVKWIGRRSYAGRFAAGNPEILPVVIRAGALADGVPRRDLSVSPLHAMFLDGVLIPASALVNGRTIVQAASVDRVEYFHIELDTHDVILAEGAPSETFIDDDSRGMFQNAAEYRAMYPDTPRAPAQFCAPRIEDGTMLEAVRQRLAVRAGLASAAAPGPLQGRLDEVSRGCIRFWAYDPSTPDTAVRLRVIDNGVVLGEAVADQYRADLEEAGIGDGCHAFHMHIPGGLAPAIRHVIEVQRVSDGAALANTPWVLDAEAAPVTWVAPAATASGNLDSATRERVVGWAEDADGPAALQILDNGALVARVLANVYRADLASAGIGSGRHGFDVAIPGGLSPLTRHVIQVRRERDGAELPGSPWVIEPAGSFSAELEQAVAQAVAAVGSADDRQRVLSFIAAQAHRLMQQQADAESGRETRQVARRLRRQGGPALTVAPSAPGPRALVIDELMPVAGRDAGSQAVLSHMRALQALGYAVSFAAAEALDAEGAALQAMGIRVCRAPFYASVEEVLRRQADSFDVVYLHRASVASRYLTLARTHAPRGRVIYSVADLHHVRLERQAAVEERPELLAISRRLRLEECRAAWAADAVITHSAAEADLLRRAVPEANVHVVGWDLPLGKRRAPFAARRGVAFIGNYQHAPNADAAQFLVEQVMPLVWQADPGIPCHLAGHAMPDAVRSLARPGVEVRGHVADLAAELFSQMRLTVAPLRYGAGLKGKVLESLAAGVPCVMTPVAAEGLALDGAPVGADAAELAALIVELHGDQKRHRAAVRAGLALMRRDYAAGAVTEGLRAAIGAGRPALRGVA